MNLEKAILTAIEFEEKVRDVYFNASQKTSDATGQKIFSRLSHEEQYHVDFLKRKLHEWQHYGHIHDEELKTTIPAAEEIRAEFSKINQKMTQHDWNVEIEMLRKAHIVETEASNFYADVVNTLNAHDAKLFEPFIEVETNHLALVQAELDALTKAGFWFDFDELDMESGL